MDGNYYIYLQFYCCTYVIFGYFIYFYYFAYYHDSGYRESECGYFQDFGNNFFSDANWAT